MAYPYLNPKSLVFDLNIGKELTFVSSLIILFFALKVGISTSGSLSSNPNSPGTESQLSS